MALRGLVILALWTALSAVADVGSSADGVPAFVVERVGGAVDGAYHPGYLYAYAVDGPKSVRLTSLPGSRAAVSPDGSLVAFASRRGGIATMRLDGSGLKVVTRQFSDDSPAWAPDGETLYFVRYARARSGGGSCGSIFSVRAAGGPVHRVTDTPGVGSDQDPAVSPDGTRIAFSAWDMCEGGVARPHLRVVDTRGRTTSELARLPRVGSRGPYREYSCPAWSPGGAQVAYRSNSDLAVADSDGSNAHRIVKGTGALIYDSPAWSPDGQWIAFTRHVTSQEVTVVHPDGSGARRTVRIPGPGGLHVAGWLTTMPTG